MAIIPIRQFGDQVLKQKSSPVEIIDDQIKIMLKNMAETMYEARGYGLAANQIGILRQILIMDESAEGENLKGYANPTIISASGEAIDEEGCLSVGDVRVPVKRYTNITVRALDLELGEVVEIEAVDLQARIFQHEIDHLNGLLIIDRTEKEERRRALRELTNIPKK